MNPTLLSYPSRLLIPDKHMDRHRPLLPSMTIVYYRKEDAGYLLTVAVLPLDNPLNTWRESIINISYTAFTSLTVIDPYSQRVEVKVFII